MPKRKKRLEPKPIHKSRHLRVADAHGYDADLSSDELNELRVGGRLRTINFPVERVENAITRFRQAGDAIELSRAQDRARELADALAIVVDISRTREVQAILGAAAVDRQTADAFVGAAVRYEGLLRDYLQKPRDHANTEGRSAAWHLAKLGDDPERTFTFGICQAWHEITGKQPTGIAKGTYNPIRNEPYFTGFLETAYRLARAEEKAVVEAFKARAQPFVREYLKEIKG